MKNLYINTCTKDVIIKYFQKNKILREETVIGQKNNSQFIMPTIKKVLDGEIPDGIIVVVGPGSFTGIRLGVTIAKTFAYVKNIPIRAITTLEEAAVCTLDSQKIVAILENNGYFIGNFDTNNDKIEDYLYVSKDDFPEFIKKNKVITNVTIDYNKVIKFALLKDSVNPHSIKPVYVKIIEALK